MANEFTKLVGCELPIQLGPMGGIATPQLAGAITAAGGHGMLAAVMVPPQLLADRIAEMKAQAGAFGVNFLVIALEDGAVEVAAAEAPLVEFHLAPPDPGLIERAGADGALVSWVVGDAGAARAAEAGGCDLIVAMGAEAGGRLAGDVPLERLLDEVANSVRIPIVAAGGIGTAAAVRRAIDAGAAAVRCGTRFLAAAEAETHPEYVRALIDASAGDTTVTEAFAAGTPPSPHRVLVAALETARSLDDEVVGEAVLGGEQRPVPRFAPIAPTRQVSGKIAAMALYAGTSVDAVVEVAPAAEIVAELTSELG